jgi:class 3 adenylate cyclase/pimeloyl-ACP methyl ester carboxylesterase
MVPAPSDGPDRWETSHVRPQTRYARSGDVYIGYQVFGDGPFDLVVVPGALSNVEYGWELESWREYYGELASFARVLLFDKRGTGISDPVVGTPTLEDRMDDVRALMDAVGSERAALMGSSDGGGLAALFAATYPERTAALVLYGPVVRARWAPDFPWGRKEGDVPPEIGARYASPESIEAEIANFIPSRQGDSEFARWLSAYVRLSASPTTNAALIRMNLEIDVRSALSAIRAPTLVLHRSPTGERSFGPLMLMDAAASRYVAERIPGARFAELPPGNGPVWAGDFADYVSHVREFLDDAWRDAAWEPSEPERVLATVLFTDIIGSTVLAADLGDARWREILQQHHALIRRQLTRFRGHEVDTAGDGFFASFDGPARAVRCACAITDAVRELGIEVRAGLHAGECELIDGKVGGVAVHIGARVAGTAEPGEVRVSSTVKDLVAGSGLEFEERGTHELKGIPGEWQLFAVRR